MKESILKPIPKKPKATRCQEYETISITNQFTNCNGSHEKEGINILMMLRVDLVTERTREWLSAIYQISPK